MLLLLITTTLAIAVFFYLDIRKHSLTTKIKSAIKNKDFVPYYQPVVDVIEDKVVGVEVLIRWLANGECISPDKFISCLEDSGLIIPATQVLINKVLADVQHLPEGVWLSINISAKHFEADYLLKLLSDVGFENAGRFSLELTERHPISDIEDAADKIKMLYENGFDFKLDDFGTGYGGIAYLQQFGIRSIKIDKMFIDTIGTADFKVGVLESIIAFGVESGYEMIAEGVETVEQARFLSSKNIVLHQGYFYGKPMPLNEMIQFYQSHDTSISSLI
ncbi:EAL domain-containing protein [Aeromonas sp. A5]|uniref:EAL domain-containing protein n=1 Tax=unclassified Aeromonas TaxID=257493 RepID=UPI00376F6B29